MDLSFLPLTGAFYAAHVFIHYNQKEELTCQYLQFTVISLLKLSKTSQSDQRQSWQIYEIIQDINICPFEVLVTAS